MTDASYHPRLEARVDRLLAGDLPITQQRRLWEHLRGCGSCRRYYEDQRTVEEAVSPEGSISPLALERLADLVTRTDGAAHERTSIPRGWRRLAQGMLALAVATGVIVAVLPEDEVFIARGSSPELGSAGLSIFSVEPEAGRVVRLMQSDVGVEVVRGQVLQLAYRNDEHTRAFVAGIDAAGEIQWYHPADPGAGGSGMPLARQVVDEPFGTAWAVTAPLGRLWLYAFFGDQSLSRATVEDALANVHRLGGTVTISGAHVVVVPLKVVAAP